MIPLQLCISGFLSYRDPVEVDFSRISLACISGPNGAGKSSLLDALTWALFGQARKRDDSLINAQSHAAEVGIVFNYEGNVYRVQRSKPRDKSTVLEFHILQSGSWSPDGNLKWKSLTERTLRETEACIENTLRLDYETFVNASFFLQGKADQFTQQRPGDRKRILSSILGLEVWEEYRQRATDRRKVLETSITALDGRLAEIQAELTEEDARKTHLKIVEEELARLSKARQTQEKTLESIKKIAATLEEQRKLIDTLARQLHLASRNLKDLEDKAAARQREREGYSGLLERAGQIEQAFAGWQQARLDLERWNEVSAQFREQEKRRQPPLDEINAERTRFEEQLKTLQDQKSGIEKLRDEIPQLKNQLEAAQTARVQAEAELERRVELEKELNTARQLQAEARAENPRLKTEMDELKERIDRLLAAEGADCPLCGQPLSPDDRQKLIDELQNEGKDMGNRFRANLNLVRESDQVVKDLEGQIARLSKTEVILRGHIRTVDQLADRLGSCQRLIEDWESQDLPRMAEIQVILAEESYALEARQRLAVIDAELKEIGYDSTTHDAVRRAEFTGRSAEAEMQALSNARAALAPLVREIEETLAQIEVQRREVLRQQEEHDRAAAALLEAEAQAPDLVEAERVLWQIEEQENRLHMEVGAARQKVLVLDDLKNRRKNLQVEREELAAKVGQLKKLERAFGKDGVPALLIEQALPQIESKSNELLERLSGGNMSVRFVTQAAYKDKRRDDLKETLDILISDSSGTRDYEMFSGGEAFRVNFAIRLALSEVLAQRAGARLQTLVIDEGFGSQDTQGRQRLIEAINLVAPDFAKIIVITHIDELKDSFPSRIEVEKTLRGSIVSVL